MKKHAYLNLKLGIVEQYSVIVKKGDLKHWKKSGWLTYTEIRLPEGDEEAFRIYGTFNKQMETLVFNRPRLLKDIPEQEIIGRKVLGISTNLGTYGMGGPGFFGLLLNNSEF